MLLRLVSFVLLAALVAPEAMAQYGYTFGRNKVRYRDFNWQVLRTERFDVYHYPEARELAEIGARMAEEQAVELENRFGHTLGQRHPLIFYSSNLDFKQTNVTPGFIPDGVGGFFEFMKGRVVLPANGDLQRFQRVIRHELVHVYTFSKLAGVYRDHRVQTETPPPLWFTEGLAEYWSGEPDHQHAMLMRDAVASGYFVPLENLDRIAGTYQMYKEGEAWFRFVSETYGEARILEMVQEAWRDPDFRKVVAFVLGEPYTTTSERFSAWMRARYVPAYADAEIGSVVAERVSARGYSAKPAVWRDARGQRRVIVVGNRGSYTNLYDVPVDTAYRPTGRTRLLVRGERTDRFEAFHPFESGMEASRQGLLAFATQSGGRDVLHVYDLNARRIRQTYGFDSLAAVYSPSWSPDGTKIAFSGIGLSGFSDLYVFTLATGALDRLTDDPYDDRDPAWRPDGSALAFASDRGPDGETGATNVFLFDLRTRTIRPVTSGPSHDQTPEWSPDGRRLVFVSARRDSTGAFGAHDLWVADLSALGGASMASTQRATAPQGVALTRVFAPTAAAYDPVWTDDGALVFATLEHYRFTVRAIPHVADRLDAPDAERLAVAVPAVDSVQWRFPAYADAAGETGQRFPYRRRYALDFAQGNVSQNPVFGATGGAFLAFSDLLGDDTWYAQVYQAGDPTGSGGVEFIKNLNVAVTRIDQGHRAPRVLSLFRLGGYTYDIRDPNSDGGRFPLYESLIGGSGGLIFPLSQFQRIEVSGTLARSRKRLIEDPTSSVCEPGAVDVCERVAVLAAPGVSFVHDNVLYGYNGPEEGWRMNVSAAYTTDLRRSNVNFYSLVGDVRRYWRIAGPITLAQWGTIRYNDGRDARLNFVGGSWDLRGFPMFAIRAQKLWHTSHELRFPLVENPGAMVPLLEPFGIANLRGALFVDAARAWNTGYTDADRNRYLGETVGAVGAGLRLNLLGGIVLRYDFGYRYRDAFRTREKSFTQFFFGWDF